MFKLNPSRMVALAAVAAITVGLATPAFAMSYGRDNAERRDVVFVPVDSECTSQRTWCDIAR